MRPGYAGCAKNRKITWLLLLLPVKNIRPRPITFAKLRCQQLATTNR